MGKYSSAYYVTSVCCIIQLYRYTVIEKLRHFKSKNSQKIEQLVKIIMALKEFKF